MSVLKNYLHGGVEPSSKDLDGLIERYPWLEVAQAMKTRRNGEGQTRYSIDIEKIKEESEGEIINRFLRKGEYRIVAEEGDVEGEIQTEVKLDEEDDIVSEELAEIYLAHGLRSEAIEIYRKLSLLNSEKSIYFAEKIENIEKNN